MILYPCKQIGNERKGNGETYMRVIIQDNRTVIYDVMCC